MILLSLWSQEGTEGLQKPLETLAFGRSQDMDVFVKAGSSLFHLLLWINFGPGGPVTGEMILLLYWTDGKYFGHLLVIYFWP